MQEPVYVEAEFPPNGSGSAQWEVMLCEGNNHKGRGQKKNAVSFCYDQRWRCVRGAFWEILHSRLGLRGEEKAEEGQACKMGSSSSPELPIAWWNKYVINF